MIVVFILFIYLLLFWNKNINSEEIVCCWLFYAKRLIISGSGSSWIVREKIEVLQIFVCPSISQKKGATSCLLSDWRGQRLPNKFGREDANTGLWTVLLLYMECKVSAFVGVEDLFLLSQKLS